MFWFDPHRSVIAFAAWSSFAHAVTMSIQGFEMPSERTGFLIGSGVLAVIGDGARYPHLVRNDKKRDYLDELITPRAESH